MQSPRLAIPRNNVARVELIGFAALRRTQAARTLDGGRGEGGD